MSSHPPPIPNFDPIATKIIIKKSMQAFVCGLIGILPIIGVIPGIYAIICSGYVHGKYPDEWNPASLYLSWGARLGAIGVLFSILTVCALMLAWVAMQFD
jgi:hypothetical protein